MSKVIGFVGEDPNDSDSIINLLKQKFGNNITYVKLIQRIRGHGLDNPRTKNSLIIECDKIQPDVVVFIRDADGICTQKIAIDKCTNWHKNMTDSFKLKNLLLINIYELEALIFANIDTFNNEYKTNLKGNRDITFISEPKEELIRATRQNKKKFRPSDCPNVFAKMDINTVSQNCKYFNDFLATFTSLVYQ